MVIDSSALVAILLDEPERAQFEDAIRADLTRLVSAVTKLEASIVLFSRQGRPMLDELDLLFSRIATTIIPFDDHQADIARDAFARFGKGRHRPVPISEIAPPVRCCSKAPISARPMF